MELVEDFNSFQIGVGEYMCRNEFKSKLRGEERFRGGCLIKLKLLNAILVGQEK